MSNRTVWTNTAGGNNHSLVVEGGKLVLTVVKPDGAMQRIEAITQSTADQWQAAFAELGPKWNQDEGSESNVDGQYTAVRRARTPFEEAIWTVNHSTIDGQKCQLRDQLQVVLNTTEE